MCENKTIIVKTNNMCKKFIMIYMSKELIDVKSNKIFVLQTAGKGTSCPACVWQTDLHTATQAHTADKWQPAISRFAHTSYLNCGLNTICVNGIKSKERVHFGLRKYWSSWQNYGYCLLSPQGTPLVFCTDKTPRGYCAGTQA